MHETQKITRKSYMWFYKIYAYYTNTKKKYSALSADDKLKCEMEVVKYWVLAKNDKLTQEDIVESIMADPDMYGFTDQFVVKDKKWKYWSKDYVAYPPHPLTQYDVKLLVNIFGIRLFRLI